MSSGPMASILMLAPDPDEADALVRGFDRRRISHVKIDVGVMDCVSFPALDLLIAVGGNGKAQYGIQAQYLIDRCAGVELLVCVGAAGRLNDALQIGDIVLGSATVEHDYKERFNPRPAPWYDASPAVLSEFARLADSTAFPFKVHVGVIASGDEDIVDPARAAELREATGALCVAWEGSGGARAARLNGVSFIEMRGITDGADADAARFFRDNVGDVMSNVVELMMAWSLTRRSVQRG
jgi:adenosylhomocysteine nucleosidase